jgi:hypothetical protein
MHGKLSYACAFFDVDTFFRSRKYINIKKINVVKLYTFFTWTHIPPLYSEYTGTKYSQTLH